jgi:hypothetical protein
LKKILTATRAGNAANIMPLIIRIKTRKDIQRLKEHEFAVYTILDNKSIKDIDSSDSV